MMYQRSYSEIQTASRCLKAYKYRTQEQLQRIKRDGALTLGRLFHEARLAVDLRPVGQTPDQALSIWWQQEKDKIDSDPMLFSDEKVTHGETLETAYELAFNYGEHYRDDQFTVLHAEEEFSLDLEVGVEIIRITMTPDRVVQDPDGYVWVTDYKTTTVLDLDPTPSGYDFQSLLYLLGVKQVYPQTQGFIFDQIRKKVPAVPRLNKTVDKETGLRHVSDINRVDTTYEILRDFIMKEAPDLMSVESHRRRLAELRDQSRFFHRKPPVILNEDMEQALLEDLVGHLEVIHTAEASGFFPRTFISSGYTSCDRCEFRSLCHAELVGLDADWVRRNEYEPREARATYESEDE